mgnify:CR=1 FL=1
MPKVIFYAVLLTKYLKDEGQLNLRQPLRNKLTPVNDPYLKNSNTNLNHLTLETFLQKYI